jgi:hypothetical protein
MLEVPVALDGETGDERWQIDAMPMRQEEMRRR